MFAAKQKEKTCKREKILRRFAYHFCCRRGCRARLWYCYFVVENAMMLIFVETHTQFLLTYRDENHYIFSLWLTKSFTSSEISGGFHISTLCRRLLPPSNSHEAPTHFISHLDSIRPKHNSNVSQSIWVELLLILLAENEWTKLTKFKFNLRFLIEIENSTRNTWNVNKNKLENFFIV